jgi:hypothetical protein
MVGMFGRAIMVGMNGHGRVMPALVTIAIGRVVIGNTGGTIGVFSGRALGGAVAAVSA